jgi:hypothetical protein
VQLDFIRPGRPVENSYIDDGLVIQELDSYLASKNGFAVMKDLFDRAQRHAADINGALDDLMRELDELSNQE